MKKVLFVLCLLMSGSKMAFADNIDDLFAGGEDREFEFARFSEANVMEAISHDAGMACKNGLCTLTSNDTRFKEFSINMNGGMGNNENGGFGGYGPGSGTGIGIFLPTTGGSSLDLPFESRLHANINIQLKVGTCVRTVKIPRSLYYAINRYMYGLMNEDSTTRRSFTPADEAMILFYTTVMKEASACK
ncbi:MAG: hypothetical protein ACHQYQ_09330 [Bacteriovoracales bacterium]